jgi:synaptobrevin family protein YKT6
VTSLSVFKWNGELHDPHCLANAQDLSAFGYFQRSTVKEMLLFVSRTIVKRTQPGQRQSVEHQGARCGSPAGARACGSAKPCQRHACCALPRGRPGPHRRAALTRRARRAEYIAHVANRGGLVAILFADREYPVRAAFSVLQKARPAPRRRIAGRSRTLTRPWCAPRS